MKIKTALKALSLIFTLLLIVIVAPLGYLLFSDANDFKPQLQQLALEQGVQLDIAGDLKWQVYPNIELEISDVILKSEQEDLALDANLGMTKLQVELRPLFSGELKIREIKIFDSNLAVRERVKTGTAEQEIDEPRNDDLAPEAGVDEQAYSPALSVQLISIKNLNLQYMPPGLVGDEVTDDEPVSFNIDELNIEQLNLDGEPFHASLLFNYKGQTQQEVEISTEALLTINLKKQSYSLTSDQFELEWGDKTPLKIDADVNASANIASNQWSLTLSRAQIDDLMLKANASGSLEPLSSSGQIEMNGGAQLIGSHLVNATTDQNTPEKISLRAGFDYSPERLLLNEVAAIFNSSNLEASVEYHLKGSWPNQVRLNLDKVNLDDYQNAASEEQDEDISTNGNPLQFLERVPATDIYLDIGELSFKGQKLTGINVEATLANSEAGIKLVAVSLASGTIKGEVVARSSEVPQIIISGLVADQVSLADLTLDESGRPFLQGIANLDFDGHVSTLTAGSAVKELNGSGQLDVSDLLLTDINMEQSICASAKQLGATAALTEQWTAGTQFDQFSSPYKISEGMLSLENMGTGFGNIKLNGGGKVNLDSMDFGAKLSMQINGDRTSEQGCSINKYLRNTRLPLSCEGNLSEDGDASCGLDGSVVAELLKGQIKNELGRQLSRLLGGNQDEEGSETTGSGSESEQDSTDQVKDAVKGLLEGLFK